MSELTFDQLPQAVSELHSKLENIEKILLQKSNIIQPPEEELLTVQDTAEFLSLSVPTIYGLISKGEIPVMKRSKRCYFSKVELIEYLKAGRKSSFSEIEKKADSYIKKSLSDRGNTR